MRTASFNLALILDRLAVLIPPFLYGFGVCLLLAKVFHGPSASTDRLALAALVVFFLCFSIDLIRRGKAWYSSAYAVAWLDLHNHSGGGIIAGDPQALASAKIKPSATLWHLAKKLLFPVCFLCAVLLTPAHEGVDVVSGAGVEKGIVAFERKAQQAEEAGVIAKPDAEELRRQARQLRDLAENNPEAAAEALASLPGRMESAAARRLDRGADALEKTLAALREMESGTTAGDVQDAVGEVGSSESMVDMYQALEELVKGEGGLDNLSPELREALDAALCEGGACKMGDPSGRNAESPAPSREALRKMAQALSESGMQQVEAASLSETGEAVSGGDAGAEGGAGERIRSLSEELSGGSAAAVVAGGMRPGAGGVSRGPGDAPLFFGDESDAAGVRFEHKGLPNADAASPGVLLERERAAIPEDMAPEEFRMPSPTGAAGTGAVHAGNGAASLGPERARAAERYFRELNDSN